PKGRRGGQAHFAPKAPQNEPDLAPQNEPDPDRLIEMLKIFSQVCHAVAFAHEQHVIHRDLKPANVMVGEHGEVQLLDWGLAKLLSSEDSAESAESGSDTGDSEWATVPGSMMGTLAYVPPEQARGSIDEIDYRSDVFGLGAMLCEILTGQP